VVGVSDEVYLARGAYHQKSLHTSEDCHTIENANTRPVDRDQYEHLDICRYCQGSDGASGHGSTETCPVCGASDFDKLGTHLREGCSATGSGSEGSA